MNLRRQGDVGEAEAILYYTINDFSVFYPLTEATRVDLIVCKGDDIRRVQVKTSTRRSINGYYDVRLATSGGAGANRACNIKNISKDEVDEIFIRCDNGSIWIVPSHVVDGKGAFSAGYKNREYCVGGPAPSPPDPKHNLPRKPKPVSTKTDKTCPACGIGISSKASTCRAHVVRGREPKISWPSTEKLLELLEEHPYTAVASRLGVSDNAVRKRLERQGYDYKTLEKVDN